MNATAMNFVHFPVLLDEIARIVRDMRDPKEPLNVGRERISRALERLTVVCNCAMTPTSAWMDTASSDPEVAQDARRNLKRELDEVEVPGLHKWTSGDGTIATLSPVLMRTGMYHEQCQIADQAGQMLKMVTWRYLAVRLAVHRALHSPRNDIVCNWEGEAVALMYAARSQRELLRPLHLPEFGIAGDLTALSIMESGSHNIDSYLFNVNELRASGCSAHTLIARVKSILDRQNSSSINHKFLMTDDINNVDFEGPAYCEDHHIVIGNPDEVRFVVLVSKVPDTSKDDKFLKSFEGRFELDRERMRSVLLGLPIISDDSAGTAEISALPKNVVTIPAVRGRAKFRDAASNASPDVDAITEEPALSRAAVARAFFGYKGLPEP